MFLDTDCCFIQGQMEGLIQPVCQQDVNSQHFIRFLPFEGTKDIWFLSLERKKFDLVVSKGPVFFIADFCSSFGSSAVAGRMI